MNNSPNKLIVYRMLNDALIDKVSMNMCSLRNCNSVDDFLTSLNSIGNELWYFNEKDEMIFIGNHTDFVKFKKIVAKKQFLNNEVYVLCSNSKPKNKKYGTVDKIRSMEVEINAIQSESVSVSDQKSARKSKKSSELSVYPQNSEIPKKSKRLLSKSGRLYSAVIEEELNYLPGSEISDAQTICKMWKIRNTGSKKWKENTIQCILLPTEFSDWVYCQPINVPSCSVDKKVVAAMVIHIKGKSSDKQMSSEYCCQNINLKWLLFSNKLISESSLKFHDYILTCVELNINFRWRPPNSRLDSDLQTLQSSMVAVNGKGDKNRNNNDDQSEMLRKFIQYVETQQKSTDEELEKIKTTLNSLENSSQTKFLDYESKLLDQMNKINERLGKSEQSLSNQQRNYHGTFALMLRKVDKASQTRISMKHTNSEYPDLGTKPKRHKIVVEDNKRSENISSHYDVPKDNTNEESSIQLISSEPSSQRSIQDAELNQKSEMEKFVP